MKIRQEQTRYEIHSWLRMLDYQQQEIIYMKTCIAELVKGNVDKDILDQLENFQNIFVTKDTVIAFFRRDIQRLQDRLDTNGITPGDINALRKDVLKMEQEFHGLKRTFNECIEQLG